MNQTWLYLINRSIFLLFFAFILLFSGCTLFSTDENAEDKAVDKEQPGLSVAEQIKILEQQNNSLMQKLNALEAQITELKTSNQVKNQSMDKSISLMESSLTEIETAVKKREIQKTILKKKLTSEPAVVPKENSAITEPGEEKTSKESAIEISTPKNSKAVESIVLLPPTKKHKTSGQEDIEKPVHEQSSLQDNELPPSANYEPAVPDENSANIVPENKFQPVVEDPDLVPSHSPLLLKIVSGAKRTYAEAYKLFSQRNYSLAIKKFDTFLINFPTDLNADNSQFWIGRAYYAEGQLFLAEQAFRKVLRNYPHGETIEGYKTPDAILMLGHIYAKRNNTERCKYYFRKVIQLFPDSLSSSQARKELKSLSKLIAK